MRGVPSPESVAAHTYGVVLTTWTLCEEGGEGIDRERALIMALLHDLAECVLGDLPQPALHYLTEEAKRRAEAEVHRDLLTDLPHPARCSAILDEYAEGETPTARLVHEADQLDMLIQARAYEVAGHRGLDEFWQKAEAYRWSSTVAESLYRTLMAERNDIP